MQTLVKRFFHQESASGILLIIAMVLALIAANTPLHILYTQFLALPVSVAIGNFSIAKPLLLWINDGLMALFFLLIGLELKREILIGHLNQASKIMLPAFAAIGGMLVPALIYIAINRNDEAALRGWAIPTATDIAFALGVLILLGSRIPSSLKVFLVSLAIFDDVGAIVIIALFYTAKLSLSALLSAATGLLLLWWFNRKGVTSLSAYLLIGLVVWVSLLKSGVHATLAGVAVAMFIPLHGKNADGVAQQPLQTLEDKLHSPINFVVLPLFAFANAGLPLLDLSLTDLFSGIPLGIMLGLLLGKQIGVLSFTWLAIKLRIGKLPDDVSVSQLYGAAILCGIGFTMSLFIASLAFEHVPDNHLLNDKLGILVGSVISAVVGYCWLAWVAKPKA